MPKNKSDLSSYNINCKQYFVYFDRLIFQFGNTIKFEPFLKKKEPNPERTRRNTVKTRR